jgi:hypothetical protein
MPGTTAASIGLEHHKKSSPKVMLGSKICISLTSVMRVGAHAQ